MVYVVGVDLLNESLEDEEHSVSFPLKREKITKLTMNSEEWIFFYDIRSEIDNSVQDEFRHALEKMDIKTETVVDRKEWLPFAVRRKWLYANTEKLEEILNLKELLRLLRKQESVKLFEGKWPVKIISRPSAEERFNMRILKNWWLPYDSKYLENASQERESLQQGRGIALTESQYQTCYNKSYDVIELFHIEDSHWEQLKIAVSERVVFYYFDMGNKKVLLSGIDESKSMKRTERGLEQTIWLQKVKKVLAEKEFTLCGLATNVSGGTVHEYYAMNQIVIGKRDRLPKGVVVLIDMPGIGDAVRLVHLFPEIKEKFKGRQVTAIVSSKCCKIYELCKEIDKIFICSLRPDLPKFPYIIPSQLSEYFMVHPFEHVISLAWDTRAYLDNIKRNFFRVYADLAHVQGNKRTELQFDSSVEKSVQDILREAGITGEKPVIGMQFIASMPSKSWSPHITSKFISILKRKLPDVYLVNLDYHDIPLEGIYNVGSHFDIVQFMAVLKYCDYFIGIDSSGGHIAAMVDTPAITVYGKEKPRTGNDHRPLSDRNISIIPAENCECPEYNIECQKGQKCIDTVFPETVLYALYKGISLGYSDNRKKIDLCLNIYPIWRADNGEGKFHVSSNLSENTIVGEYGVGFDLNGFTKEIELGEITIHNDWRGKLLGVDMWIEEDTFKFSSYAMLQLEIYLNTGETITLSHRLIEGWNLMQFRELNVNFWEAKLNFKIIANKKLSGSIYMNQLYSMDLVIF